VLIFAKYVAIVGTALYYLQYHLLDILSSFHLYALIFADSI